MCEKPLVSLVVPVYNAEKYLQNCIDNILKQTYSNFELILVNDGSTDDSKVICDENALKDVRVKVIHKKNEGAGSARNSGIQVARGEFITFPDADDILYPRMLEITLKNMINNKVDLVIFNYENIVIDGSVTKVINRNKLFNKTIKNNTSECHKLWFDIRKLNISQLNTPWNKLYKTDIIKQNNIKFPDIRRAQDAVFNLFYYDKISSVSVIDDIFYGYNSNDQEKVWMKFPENSIDYFVEYNRVMEEIISGWGMYFSNFKALCDNNLIGNICFCFTLCNNPKWRLSFTDKIKYIKQILQIPYIQYRIENYSGNIPELSQYVRYIKEKDPIKIYIQMKEDKITEKIKNNAVAKKIYKYSIVCFLKSHK